MLEIPLCQVIRDMEIVPYDARKYHPGTFHGHGYYRDAPAYNNSIAGRLEAIKRRVGICLDCVQRGAADGCSFQHTRRARY